MTKNLESSGGPQLRIGLVAWLVSVLAFAPALAGDFEDKAAEARAFVASIRQDRELQAWLDVAIERQLARDPRAHKARLGIALVDLPPEMAPRIAHRNGDEPFYPASVVKFVYLIAAYAWQEQGRVPIEQGLDRQLTSMIYESSNAATQRVFRALTRTQAGPDLGEAEYAEFRERRLAVKRWLQELGINGIHAIHPTYDGGGDLYGRDLQLLRDGAMNGGISNAAGTLTNRQAMTAVATAELLALLATDLALSPSNSEEVRRRMQRDPRKQPYQRHRIAGGAMETAGVQVYSKSGTWGPIFADAGIMRGPSGGQLVLVVFMEATPGYRGGFIAGLARACARDLLDKED